MKRMFVFLIACFLCFSTVTISYAAVPAFDNTQWLELPSGFGGGSHNYPQSTVVTYSDLKAIRLQVNSWLSEGQYKGFRGTASISYNGSTYFIQLVQGGIAYRLCNSSGGLYRTESEFDKPTTSTGSSTYDFNQTIINNHAPSSGGTITTPSVSSSWSDRNLQEKIYQSLEYIYQCVDLANGYLSNNGWIAIDIRNTIQKNVVPAIEAVNKNLISFKDSTVTNLNALYTITEYSYIASLSQLDVLNRLYSGVTSIDSRLDSVISNGAVQVNTGSIDARLDKLISMYSKVNSVVLDTAAVNGGQIKSAVGGELMDVMFWGNAKRQNPYLLTSPINYSLSGASVSLGAPELRSIPLGSSIPAYISGDPVLAAGVWKSGSTYYLSDTYNAVTGEYVQRIKSIVFDGSENWVRSIRANDASLFSVSCIPDNTLSMRAVQLHKLAFHQLCRVVIPGNADFLAGAAYRFKHDVHDLVQHFLVHHVILAKMLILNVVKDDFTVNLKCFIFSVCRFLSLPIRRRSRLSLVLRQGKGVRGKDRNGIGT